MRLLFIDRVTELSRAERIAATFEWPADDPLFAHHFPANPMLPASALIESFAQAATILLETSHAFTRKAFPVFVRDARFHRAARPGRPIALVMTVEQWSEDAAVLRGVATQDGARTTACVLGMSTAPLAEFFGPEHARAYRAPYRRWLADAALHGFDVPPLEILGHAHAE